MLLRTISIPGLELQSEESKSFSKSLTLVHLYSELQAFRVCYSFRVIILVQRVVFSGHSFSNVKFPLEFSDFK